MSETRKLAAILVSDVAGYSRLAGADEDRTLARLRTLRSDLIDPIISVHHGRVVKRTGDGSVIEFRSVVDAVRCAVEVQTGLIERNAGLPPEKRIEFRSDLGLTQLKNIAEPVRVYALEVSAQARQSAILVRRGESAVTDNVGYQDRCELPGLAHPSGTPALRISSMIRSRPFKKTGLSL